MKAQTIFSCLLLCSSILLTAGVIEADSSSSHHHGHHGGPTKLFVFGDSYADTGNDRNPLAYSWKEPYGITYPKKPTGRFSDGLVFTDFLAMSLGLKSPVPYIRRNVRHINLNHGMNFAFGGTGVFDTKAPYPNMTTQIDILQKLISKAFFTPQDLQHSLVHVSLAGNDYTNYFSKGGTIEDVKVFIAELINQLALNLERIYKMGAKKISVTALQPLGCVPLVTFRNSFQQCNPVFNQATQYHNHLLKLAIAKFNNQTSNVVSPPFIILDFYKAFSSVIQAKGDGQKKLIFNAPLEPCCMGINSTFSCGSLDGNGNKMYNVCKDPRSSFFWDQVHPTQAGWQAITLSVQPTIQQLRYK